MYIITVWIHIVAACVWVGGLLFFGLVIVPVLRRLESREGTRVVRALGRQFRPVGWGSLVVLVVTGILNLTARWATPEQLASATFWTTPFGSTLALKLFLVALVIAATAAHDVLGARAVASAQKPGAEGDAAAQRRIASWLGRITTLLALGVVLVAVMLVRGW